MDRRRLDRMLTFLSDSRPRRDALRVLTSTAIAGIASRFNLGNSLAGTKKRCRKRRQTCGGKRKCCGHNTACHQFPTSTCMSLTGRHCRGLEGAPCDNAPDKNNCDCCDGLFCGGVSGQGRCQETPS